MSNHQDTDRLVIARRDRPVGPGARWTWWSFAGHAGLMLIVMTQIGIPAEGDPKVWWMAAPVATALVASVVVWVARNPLTGLGVLVGGLAGSLGMLVVLFVVAASAISS